MRIYNKSHLTRNLKPDSEAKKFLFKKAEDIKKKIQLKCSLSATAMASVILDEAKNALMKKPPDYS